MPSINNSMMNSVLESSFAMNIAEKLLDFISKIPHSEYSPVSDPHTSAAKLKQRCCAKAAGTSAVLAFPVGAVGWLTIVPELLAVWRIQARMVADIAALHGHSDKLTKEVMLYCLFNHSSKEALKDVTARVGERAFLRSTSSSMARQITARVGTRFTQKAIQRMVTRWVPVIGALGMGAYVYYDTHKVANTTLKYFANPFPINDEKLAEMMESAHRSAEDSANKVDQMAETVKKKAEDLADKAKDQWQHYRERAETVSGKLQEKAESMTSKSSDHDHHPQTQQTDHPETSTIPHRQQKDADARQPLNESPIVAGNDGSDTFTPAEPQQAQTGVNKNTASMNKSQQAKSNDSKDALSGKSDDKLTSKSPSSASHLQQQSGSSKPQNGLYQ